MLQDESAQSKRNDHAQADDGNVQYINGIPVSLTRNMAHIFQTGIQPESE